ncbi:MAG: hypothetical protein R2867_12155 [Caldilineaceae bacterium]
MLLQPVKNLLPMFLLVYITLVLLACHRRIGHNFLHVCTNNAMVFGSRSQNGP